MSWALAAKWQRIQSWAHTAHDKETCERDKNFLNHSPDDCLELQCFSEEEGALFLMQRSGVKGKALYQDAIDLVNELGGLPLALEQAAAYISALPIPCSFKTYLDKYRDIQLSLLKQQPATARSIEGQHRLSVHTTWLMNVDFVRNKSPAAGTMLNIAAFLHGDIPIKVIYPIFSELEQEELKESVHSEFDMGTMLKELCCYSLISVIEKCKEIRIHKLVQEVVRESLTPSMQDKIIQAILRGLHKLCTVEVKTKSGDLNDLRTLLNELKSDIFILRNLTLLQHVL